MLIFILAGLHEEHAGATWNFGYNLLQEKRKVTKTSVELAGLRTFLLHTDF